MKIEANMKIIDNEKLFAVGDVTIADLFVIHQVKVLKMGNDYDVFLPRKQGADGWRNVVGITDKELLGTIKRKVKEAVTESAQISYLPEESVKIEITPYEKGAIRGYARVNFDDAIEISGIQIREKEGKLHVVYPYTMQGENIQSLISTRNPFVRESLQQYILEAYQKKTAERRLPEQRRQRT